MIVYVVPESPAVAAALQSLVSRFNAVMAIRQMQRFPNRLESREPTFVVIDLTSGDWQRIGEPRVHARVAKSFVLARPGQMIPSEWMEFANREDVTPIRVVPRSATPFGDLLALLEQQLDAVPTARILDGVLYGNPDFQGIANVVKAILESPWSIRKPEDLAAHLGMTVGGLHQLLKEMGAVRVEHLITAIRAIALQYLLQKGGLSIGRARLIVGIDDPSNFRRQLGRAHYLLGERGQH